MDDGKNVPNGPKLGLNSEEECTTPPPIMAADEASAERSGSDADGREIETQSLPQTQDVLNSLQNFQDLSETYLQNRVATRSQSVVTVATPPDSASATLLQQPTNHDLLGQRDVADQPEGETLSPYG